MKQLTTGLVMMGLIFLSACGGGEMPENHGNIQSQLYLGQGDAQPLMVGLGGSEGGNAWSSDYWKATRDKFIGKGFAFLAIGYFGMDGTPEKLDRIAIDRIYQEILRATDNPKIDGKRIYLIGGSKGAELALVMASHYKRIGGVVAIVPSHVVFPALTFAASTSSWTINDEELPYVPMGWDATPSVIKGNMRGAFSVMLEDKVAVKKALIKVENINGPVLLMSARKDEMWPSTEMSEEIMKRFRDSKFPYAHDHIAIAGGHTAPLKHMDSVFAFLDRHVIAKP